MRLLRHLLPRPRRSTRPSPLFALTPAALTTLELDYDPLVAQLANQCR
ncbi:MAG: hypothetical protein V4574_16975 [Pseudomonadota bacterium]